MRGVPDNEAFQTVRGFPTTLSSFPGSAWAVQSVRFRSGIRVRVLVGFCSAHVLAQFRVRGGMKFIPIGMADISRRLRPQADTAGIGTRKLASTPVGVAERWHPYRGAKGIIRFRDRWYRRDGLNHRLMSGNPTGFLSSFPGSAWERTVPEAPPQRPGAARFAAIAVNRSRVWWVRRAFLCGVDRLSVVWRRQAQSASAGGAGCR